MAASDPAPVGPAHAVKRPARRKSRTDHSRSGLRRGDHQTKAPNP